MEDLVGLLQLFKRQEKTRAPLPEVFSRNDNPVNYNSVLDYMVGLSKEDFEKITSVIRTYRDANKKAAGILGVADQPMTTLMPEKPTDEEIDDGLDEALSTDHLDFLADDEPAVIEPKKEQAPATKIEIKD